jgi:hypothetical protein
MEESTTLFVSDTKQFVIIARIAGRQAKELEARRPRMPAQDDLPALKEWVQADILVGEAADRQAYVALLFAACAAEAFINSYAARAFSAAYFDAHIDKLDIVSKWVLVPRLAVGFEVDRCGQEFQLLRRLVAARNRLAHPKITKFASEDDVHRLASRVLQLHEDVNEAMRALDALADLVEAFAGSDEAEVLRTPGVPS